MAQSVFPAITSWDAILSARPVIAIPPGDRPRGAVLRDDGVYLKRGNDIAYLSESSRLSRRLADYSILIILEADEQTCRMTQISMRNIAHLRG